MTKKEKNNKELKEKLDLIIKIVLIVIIIILLIHNCELQRKGNHNKKTPNGNVDIIEIKCDNGKCSPVTSTDTTENVITEISFLPQNASVKVGNRLKLIPIINPTSLADAKLIWKSSDTSIATVDENGTIKGLKEGTVTITVTSPNGVLASCTVSVVKDKIDVNKIVLDPSKLSLSVGDIYQIIAKAEPENATERELVFESSNPSIATVNSNGVIKGIRSGVVTITVKTKDGKVVATCKVTVEAKLDVYDSEKGPITWNGSNDLKIFTKSIYNVDGVIAPESENTYQFIVRNNTSYKINYNVKFIETNDYNINMKYKLKKNDSYLINNYSDANALAISDFVLNPGENDTYYLDWKWISSSNDTSIGKNPEAKYGLKIVVEAESINE